MNADAIPHSHCAWCAEPSVLTIRPSTTWRSATRIAHDVCLAHLLDAIFSMQENGVAWVEVGQVVKRPGLPYWP